MGDIPYRSSTKRYRRIRSREYRARLYAKGLTCRRTTRKKNLRPELKLRGKDRDRVIHTINEGRRRQRLKSMGLNSRGEARTYKLHPELDHLPRHKRFREYQRNYYRQRYAPWLLPSTQELAWREFRATILVSNENGDEND